MATPLLPPAPYGNPMVSKDGLLTPIWSKWIGQLFIQTGGSTSTSLSSVITTVATLSTTVTAQSAEISTLIDQVNGLSVGPIL